MLRRKQLEHGNYKRSKEKTGRKCRKCGQPIYRIKDGDGITLSENWFFCHRLSCRQWREGKEKHHVLDSGVGFITI